MIEITIEGNVTVRNCPPGVVNVAKKTLTIPNPTYHKIVRLTGSRWAAAVNYKYYTLSKEGVLTFPNGFLLRFIGYLDKYKIPYEIVDRTVDRKSTMWIPKKPELREYQVPIVEKMVAAPRGGVVVAGTGSGKTVMTLESIRKQQRTALILVPNTVIQDQFVKTAYNMFGLSISQINANSKEIGDYTVSTWQSLMADPTLITKLKSLVSHVYVDECHQIVSDKRQKVLEGLAPRKIYGLSGSPRRSKEDGRTKAIFFILGDTIAEYAMTQMTPRVKIMKSGANIPVLDYHQMIDEMVRHENRNTLITGLVAGESMSGRKILVLTKRIEHAATLYKTFEEWPGAHLIESADSGRNALLEELANGDKDFVCLFGTVSLLATGLDIPSLNAVVFACDIKSDILVQQGAGRILRLFEGKEDPIIYDIMDDKNPILTRQFWERKQFYDLMGWQIM